jgi:hypothetical protein
MRREEIIRLTFVAASALTLALPLAAADPVVLKPSPKTVAWGYYDARTPPVLRVKSGDTVEIHTLITSSPARLEGAGLPPADVEPALRQIHQEVTNKGPGGHILTGPVYVEGAEPGDTLEVKIEAIRLAIPYAYNAFSPGRGFLPEDFPYARMRIIPLDEKRMVARFAPASKSLCAPSSGAWGSRRRSSRDASTAVRPGFTPATWTTRSSWRARRSTSPCTPPAPCFSRATGMPVRAMAKWTSPRSRRLSSAPSG